MRRLNVFTVLTLLVLLCGLYSVEATGQQQETSTTWLVVRHAEKDANELLTAEGRNRARELASLARVFRVKSVYATKYPRTQNTALPTADQQKTKVITYDDQPQKKWFDAVKAKHKGEAVLIVGHSNTVDKIVKGLGGVGDFTVQYSDYDNLFIVTSDKNGTTAQRLKYGK